MDFGDFVRVSSSMRRWSDKSLDIARSLLVEGRSLGEVAAAHGVSPQHANMVRSRFLKRASQVQLKDFVQQVRPACSPLLHSNAQAITTLHGKGYSAAQIVDFLDSQGMVGVTPEAVVEFLRSKQ